MGKGGVGGAGTGLEDGAEEAGARPFRELDEGRVVAQHEAELDVELLLLGRRHHRGPLRPVLARRLVQPQVLAGGDDLLRLVQALVVGPLAGHRLDALVPEHLLQAAEPVQPGVRRVRLRQHLLPPRQVGLPDADEGHQWAVAHGAGDGDVVRVLGAVLRDPQRHRGLVSGREYWVALPQLTGRELEAGRGFR